jgi:MFS family permease
MAADVTAGAARKLPRRSLGGLIAISIFWFALNFHWGALTGLIVPSQVIGLLFREAPVGTSASQWVKDFAPVTQAVIAVPGLIVALLANPFFGLLSDRTPGRFGRRRPYIVAGTAVNVVGLAMMALGPAVLTAGHSGNSLAPSIFILLAGLVVTQVSNNAAAAPFHALLPDLVSKEQRGIAAGIMGLAQLFGNIGGALVPRFFGFDPNALLDGKQSFDVFNAQIVRAYAAVAVVIVVMAALTALTVHEQPWSRPAGAIGQQTETARTVRTLLLTLAGILVVAGAYAGLLQTHIGLSLTTDSLNVVLVIGLIIAGFGTVRAFDFKARRYPDFTWVLITRFLVMMGIYIVYSFLQLYMLFVAHADNAAIAAGNFLIILTITATLSTAFAGWASDRLGRKAMVYLSGAFMALVGAAFVLAPYAFPMNILTGHVYRRGRVWAGLWRLHRRGLGAGGRRAPLGGHLRARHGGLEHRLHDPAGARRGIRGMDDRSWHGARQHDAWLYLPLRLVCRVLRGRHHHRPLHQGRQLGRPRSTHACAPKRTPWHAPCDTHAALRGTAPIQMAKRPSGSGGTHLA